MILSSVASCNKTCALFCLEEYIFRETLHRPSSGIAIPQLVNLFLSVCLLKPPSILSGSSLHLFWVVQAPIYFEWFKPSSILSGSSLHLFWVVQASSTLSGSSLHQFWVAQASIYFEWLKPSSILSTSSLHLFWVVNAIHWYNIPLTCFTSTAFIDSNICQ